MVSNNPYALPEEFKEKSPATAKAEKKENSFNGLATTKNVDAENALLILCMNNKGENEGNKAFAEISRYIKHEDFYSIANQSIFEAIEGLFADDEALSMPAVADYMDKHDLMRHIGGGPLYLSQVFGGTAYPSELMRYVRQVKECSNRRKIILMAQDIENKMQDNTTNINDTLKDLVDDVEDVIMVNEEQEDNSLEEAFNGFIDTEKKGISYGFKALDKYLKGMQEGHFVVLGGRPAMGKTAFALNIVRNVCRAGKKVLIFSLEMTKKDLYKRLLSCETGFSEDEIKEAVSDVVQNGETPTSRAMYRALEAGKERIAKWDLDIVDDCYTLADIRAKAVLAKKKQGIDVVVIDHLQLMSLYDGAYKEGRTAEMTEITKRLVPLAKRIKATILCLSQVNRGNEGRTDKRPMSSDLKESGSIEQDADAIMMIYRDKYYDENGDDWTEIIIRKNRFGAQGTVRLNYDMAKNKFTPYTGIVGEKANRSEKAQVKGAFE